MNEDFKPADFLPPPVPTGGAPADPSGSGRRLTLALVALYALSILGAVVVLLRRPSGGACLSGKGLGSIDREILPLSEGEAVGWVPIHGAIFNSQDGRPWENGVEQWTRRLRAVAATRGIKAIVLDINSPGGSVGAVQELYSQILRVRMEKKIPVVALFDDVAASGGYYIAAACDRIVAHPGTLTGSIGVIFSVGNFEGLLQKIGVRMNPVKSGKFKDIGSPTRPMSEEERALLQDLINDAYGQFVAAVAQGRNMPVSQVRPLADGRIYSGSQAFHLRLVDALGDSTDAVELAGKLAGIKGRPRVRRGVERFSDFLDMLDSRLSFLKPEAGAAALLGAFKPAPAGLEYLWTGWRQ